ncbi:MAG: NAD-dependent epimerase/dehydratase family protein, partial [Acetobacterales bacterium]
MSGQHWLVTGAAGFIGSNLSAYLLARGDRVTGLDDLSTGTEANIGRLRERGGDAFAFVRGDIRDPAAVRAVLGGVDVVAHLAAQVSVPKSFDDPCYTDSINVAGFLSVATAAEEAGVARVIYVSSCAIYGDNPALPLAETEAPRPLSPYAVSKLANELYADTLRSRTHGPDLVGLRLFNIYGPWQDHRGGYAAVIPKWIELCAAGERPVLFGDGSATRDFCFVDDVARLIAGIGGREERTPHAVYNVGTGVATSLTDLFAGIRDALAARGVSLPFDGPGKQPPRHGDIVHSLADIGRARADLGFEPLTPLA